MIELLIVIGIIALTAGVLGLALRGGSPAAALQSAQGTLGSMLSAARSQAALEGKEAALLVVNDPVESTGDRHLRALVVGIAADASNTVFTPVGDYVLLPKGCALLPDSSPTGGLVENGVDFGSLKSSALIAVPLTTLAGTVNCLGVKFSALGMPDGRRGNLVLATVTMQSAGANPPIKFNNAANVRGVALSAYGAVSFINDASGFDTSAN